MAEKDEKRRDALDTLLALQQDHFEGLFKAMEGLPVTIRLLDPPLHEFLPDLEELAEQEERAAREERRPRGARANARPGEGADRDQPDARHPRRAAGRAATGCVRDADARDRARRLAVRRRPARRRCSRSWCPLVAYEHEIELMRERLEEVIADEEAADLELPSAR